MGDIEEIDNLKLSKYLVYHKIDNFDFYNGIKTLILNSSDFFNFYIHNS
jgi:hypothetical protein